MQIEHETEVFYAIGDRLRRKLLEVFMIDEHSIALLCNHLPSAGLFFVVLWT
jgi:hypothetical protein